MSAISVDSFDVYGNDCLVGGADTVEGFETAVSWLDKVIVAEIQLNSSETSASSTAADAAFNAGSVVVAANGNFGEEGVGSVRSPGNAHKALGIGAADLQSDLLMDYSGRGPSDDGRYKPDLVFPTNIETARSGSDTALGSFGGTSAATPVSGGAAALLRNWMRGGTGSIDAGHVYSHMILGGQTTYPFNNNTGAGPFVLGTGGHAFWGKTNVTNGGRVDINIPVSAGKTKIEGSLWWPEGTVGHNDVDLELIAPDGSVRDIQHLRRERLRARRRVLGRLPRDLEAADQGLLGQRHARSPTGRPAPAEQSDVDGAARRRLHPARWQWTARVGASRFAARRGSKPAARAYVSTSGSVGASGSISAQMSACRSPRKPFGSIAFHPSPHRIALPACRSRWSRTSVSGRACRPRAVSLAQSWGKCGRRPARRRAVAPRGDRGRPRVGVPGSSRSSSSV